jgi:hypothetical protein
MTPSSPVPAGSFARKGRVSVHREVGLSGWVSFSGDVDEVSVRGVYTTSEGRTGSVRFDLNGKVLEYDQD